MRSFCTQIPGSILQVYFGVVWYQSPSSLDYNLPLTEVLDLREGP